MSRPDPSLDFDVRFLWESFKKSLNYDALNAETQRAVRLCWFTGFATAANRAGHLDLGLATERLFREVHGVGRQSGK